MDWMLLQQRFHLTLNHEWPWESRAENVNLVRWSEIQRNEMASRKESVRSRYWMGVYWKTTAVMTLFMIASFYLSCIFQVIS